MDNAFCPSLPALPICCWKSTILRRGLAWIILTTRGLSNPIPIALLLKTNLCVRSSFFSSFRTNTALHKWKCGCVVEKAMRLWILWPLILNLRYNGWYNGKYVGTHLKTSHPSKKYEVAAPVLSPAFRTASCVTCVVGFHWLILVSC